MKKVKVKGHRREDGTKVKGHTRKVHLKKGAHREMSEPRRKRIGRRIKRDLKRLIRAARKS
jgi:hypothetical protein